MIYSYPENLVNGPLVAEAALSDVLVPDEIRALHLLLACCEPSSLDRDLRRAVIGEANLNVMS